MQTKLILLLLVVLSLAIPATANARHHQPRSASIMASFESGPWVCPDFPSGQPDVNLALCVRYSPFKKVKRGR